MKVASKRVKREEGAGDSLRECVVSVLASRPAEVRFVQRGDTGSGEPTAAPAAEGRSLDRNRNHSLFRACTRARNRCYPQPSAQTRTRLDHDWMSGVRSVTSSDDLRRVISA